MLKRLSALTLALLMVIGVVGCRKTTGDFSSGSSGILEVIEESDIMLPTESTDDTPQKPNTPSNKPTTSNKPTASTPSGNDDNNSSSTDTPTTSGTTDYSALIPKYSNHEIEISGFWAPYDISEAGLKLYKDAGFNTLAMINHSLSVTSENQYYLGSKRTMKALENCKKVGLKAIISYNDWIANWAENNSNYYSNKPFSQHDIYGDYKDIIVGVHIADEPKKSTLLEISNDTLINDFKATYPNAKYIVNIIPEYAGATPYEFTTYKEIWDMYGEKIVSKFENNRMSSIDFYYFYKGKNGVRRSGILSNYELVAEFSKKYNTEQTFILQSAVSPEVDTGTGYVGNEFDSTLSEGDMRLQANMALAFGADALQYYCYAGPRDRETAVGAYKHCILNNDETPSELYYHVQKVNNEVQSYADVILSYNWDKTTAVAGMMMGVNVSEIYEFQDKDFSDSKYYVSANCTTDLVVSRFKGDKGEAYMFVNFADRENKNKADIKMKDCRAVAIYGEAGSTGTPRIVELKDGEFTLNLDYGEGAFVVPLA